MAEAKKTTTKKTTTTKATVEKDTKKAVKGISSRFD